MDSRSLTRADPGLPEAGSSETGPAGGPRLAEIDQQVVGAIRAGDYRAATCLCARRYAASLGRLCMAMVGSEAEADDLVQEVLLAAHDALPTYRAEGSLGSWLFAIARRKCARHLERRGRHEARLRLVYDAERSPATDELLVERQRAERARAALAEVRPSEREALILRYVADLSYAEVGEACGVEEATARKRVSRGLCNLRNVLLTQE